MGTLWKGEQYNNNIAAAFVCCFIQRKNSFMIEIENPHLFSTHLLLLFSHTGVLHSHRPLFYQQGSIQGELFACLMISVGRDGSGPTFTFSKKALFVKSLCLILSSFKLEWWLEIKHLTPNSIWSVLSQSSNKRPGYSLCIPFPFLLMCFLVIYTLFMRRR